MSVSSSFEMDMWSDALRVEGRLGALEVGRLRRTMQRVCLSGIREIDLDLRGVEHVDYRALKPLFCSVAECERSGARVRATYGTAHVMNLFRLAYPGVGEALLHSAPAPIESHGDDEFVAPVHVNG